MIKRAIVIIMDSVGVGALPDSEKYGDSGVNTLNNIAKNHEGFNIPNLKKLGIGNIEGTDAVGGEKSAFGAYARMAEVSSGKDTTIGHWELTGIHTFEPFNTYPEGFPLEVVEAFEEAVGRKILCNKPASGTAVIEELGEEHMKTGKPIVYTSADSVFQIAAHEDVIPLEELYRMCEAARSICTGKHSVARVIARPFTGQPGSFERTSNRRDYSVSPPSDTLLDYIKSAGKDVIAVGKIVDIFNGQGITEDIHTKSNMDGVDQTIRYIKSQNEGIIMTNLVDFDAKYGHRRNATGYAKALEEFDERIPEILGAMNEDDVVFFTADHGNDPTYKGTDHTREYVPLIVYGKSIRPNVDMGTRKSFADMAASIADMLGVEYGGSGESFYSIIKL